MQALLAVTLCTPDYTHNPGTCVTALMSFAGHCIAPVSLASGCCVQALHAVTLRTPDYTHKPGTWFSRGAGKEDREVVKGPVRREPILKALELDTFDHEVREG